MAVSNKKVLFIVIDQMRADCLNGALAQHVDLPNLRSLQDAAVSFLNHFSVTNPCGPARVSLLTGQYAMNHRAARNGTPLAAGTPNLATEARKAGYDPLLFGYTDTATDPRTRHPNDPILASYEQVMEGFNERVEMRHDDSYPWRAYLKSKGYDAPNYKDFYAPISSSLGEPPRFDDPAFYKAEDSDTAFLTNAFLDEISMRGDNMWFAHLTYIRPHPPLVAPEPYNKMYNPNGLPQPVASGEPHMFTTLSGAQYPIGRMVSGWTPQEGQDTQALRAIYLGLATEVDHQIGRILSFLKESGQYDDTLIVVTADHGEMLGDHGLWGKQHVFDPGYHVSLIIRDPEQPQGHGATVTQLTESVDVAPTLLDWIGLKPPKSMNGQSLMPFLKGEIPGNWKKSVQLELDFAGAGADNLAELGLQTNQANLAILRTEEFKLVHFNSVFEPMLFDLQADPTEQINLASDPAYQSILLEMTRALLSSRMRNMDQTMSELP